MSTNIIYDQLARIAHQCADIAKESDEGQASSAIRDFFKLDGRVGRLDLPVKFKYAESPLRPRFRAVLRNAPHLERPAQYFCESYDVARAWAREALESQPEGVYAEVFERLEVSRLTVKREPEDNTQVKGSTNAD